MPLLPSSPLSKLTKSIHHSNKRSQPSQNGAAVMIGVVILAFLMLIGIGLVYLSLSQKEGPSLSVNQTEVSADDLLGPGNGNNQLLIDTNIVGAGVKRDDDQRKAADASLKDETQPVGDGVTADTTVEAQRLSQLQTEFISETDRRIKNLSTTATLTATLAVDQKAQTNKLINDETTALTGLKAKAAAETTKEAFLADRDSLDKEYINYGLALAQVNMLIWANSQLILDEKVNVLGGKFQERLNTASNNGSSTASAQTLLNSYQTNKKSAKEQTTGATKSITSVKPDTYNANRAVLKTYFDQLDAAHTQNDNAWGTAKQLVTVIKTFK